MRLESPVPARPMPRLRLPDLPSLPGLPSFDLSPLRELAEALPRAAQALPSAADLMQPARDLLEQSPLSARYWENLKPVAIAGAFAVGGLGLLWILFNLRNAAGLTARMGGGGGAGGGAQGPGGGGRVDPERLALMVASRGLIR